MTRINCVPVAELYSKHLLAEYRELPRVFSLVERFQASGGTPALLKDQPSEYVRGKGHVKFFYTRLLWLSNRHQQLIAEMVLRGYNPLFRQPLSVDYGHLEPHWWGDWDVTDAAMLANRARINERLKEMGQ